MKSFLMCALIGGLVFSVSLGLQLSQAPEEEPAATEGESTEPAPAKGAPPAAKSAPPAVKSAPPAAKSAQTKAALGKRLRFPDDLASATISRPRPILQTAAFSPGPGVHKIAVLKPGGQMHEWQDYIPEEWRASRVEDTELVVVVGGQKKTFVDEIHFQAGPPIKRYMFDLVVSVVEPKTAQVIGYRTFRNVPRNIRNMEAWETTALGRPVGWNTVYRWVSTNARIGFPEEHDPSPVVNQTDG